MSADDVIERAVDAIVSACTETGVQPDRDYCRSIAQALHDAGLLFSDHGGTIINRTFSDAETWRLRGEFLDALARGEFLDALARSHPPTIDEAAHHLCRHLDNDRSAE